MLCHVMFMNNSCFVPRWHIMIFVVHESIKMEES